MQWINHKLPKWDENNINLNVLVEIQSQVESNIYVVTNMHRTSSKSFGQQLLVMTKYYRLFASKKEEIKSDSEKKVLKQI